MKIEIPSPYRHSSAIWVFSLSLACAATAQAQQSALSAGSEANGTGGSVSLSVGQVDYIQLNTPIGSVYQGVQQPYQIDITNTIEETGNQVSLSAFPNPTVDELWLSVSGGSVEDLTYTLLDNRGRMFITGVVRGERTRIPIEGLSMAVYFLQVQRAGQIAKTLLIVKY
jgi:hypothetical protein